MSQSTALVHLGEAELTFRLRVEKQIQRMRDMWHDDKLTAKTPEFRAGVRSKLEQAVAEYDYRLRKRSAEQPTQLWPLVNDEAGF